jgi:hypothetical protein
MSGKCRKCGCTKYEWNPVSAVQKVASGFQISVSGDGKVISGQISAKQLIVIACVVIMQIIMPKDFHYKQEYSFL